MQIGALLFNKTCIKVLVKYSNYSNVFLTKNLTELSEYLRIYNYAIKLEKDKQLTFGSIFSLVSVEIKILKAYFETNLANSFIQPSKSFAKVPNFFNWKLDKSLFFYINN